MCAPSHFIILPRKNEWILAGPIACGVSGCGLGMKKLRYLLRRWFGDYTRLRKLVVGVLGVSILIVGTAMLLLPGPAIIVIPAGIALLATEFAWARRLLRRVKKKINDIYPRNAQNNSTPGAHHSNRTQERKKNV